MRFNIDDFDDFRSRMIADLQHDKMTGEIPESTTAEDLNAVADDIERILQRNADAIYALIPLDSDPHAGCLIVRSVCTIGGVAHMIEIEVSNVGAKDDPFFAVAILATRNAGSLLANWSS